jgi:hypothetical protein
MRAFASPQLGSSDVSKRTVAVYTPGDGEALTERILALAGDRNLSASFGARARVAFERQWDKEQAVAEWEALLKAVGHPHLG